MPEQLSVEEAGQVIFCRASAIPIIKWVSSYHPSELFTNNDIYDGLQGRYSRIDVNAMSSRLGMMCLIEDITIDEIPIRQYRRTENDLWIPVLQICDRYSDGH